MVNTAKKTGTHGKISDSIKAVVGWIGRATHNSLPGVQTVAERRSGGNRISMHSSMDILRQPILGREQIETSYALDSKGDRPAVLVLSDRGMHVICNQPAAVVALLGLKAMEDSVLAQHTAYIQEELPQLVGTLGLLQPVLGSDERLLVRVAVLARAMSLPFVTEVLGGVQESYRENVITLPDWREHNGDTAEWEHAIAQMSASRVFGEAIAYSNDACLMVAETLKMTLRLVGAAKQPIDVGLTGSSKETVQGQLALLREAGEANSFDGMGLEVGAKLTPAAGAVAPYVKMENVDRAAAVSTYRNQIKQCVQPFLERQRIYTQIASQVDVEEACDPARHSGAGGKVVIIPSAKSSSQWIQPTCANNNESHTIISPLPAIRDRRKVRSVRDQLEKDTHEGMISRLRMTRKTRQLYVLDAMHAGEAVEPNKNMWNNTEGAIKFGNRLRQFGASGGGYTFPGLGYDASPDQNAFAMTCVMNTIVGNVLQSCGKDATLMLEMPYIQYSDGHKLKILRRIKISSGNIIPPMQEGDVFNIYTHSSVWKEMQEDVLTG